MNTNRVRTALAAGVIGVAAWGGLAMWPQRSDAQQVSSPLNKPLVSWIGAYSKVEKGLEILRITDEAAWKATWLRHVGDKAEKTALGHEAVPEIDFGSCIVLAVFRGKSVNNNGEYIVSIEDRGADVLVRFDSRSFQTMSIGPGPDKGEGVRPYGLFVLRRTDRPMVVEENVQNLIGAPPKWKEQARFEALATK